MVILKQNKIVVVCLGVIFALSIWAGHKLFFPKFFTSHDGEGHVIRMMEFHQALVDGHFPVRITKRIFYGTGYPFFSYNYPLIYYLGEGLHNLGLSFVTAFKGLLFIALLAGGIGVWVWLKGVFGLLPATVAGVFYILAPYRLLSTYVRGSLAECIALGILPWLCWSTDRLVKRKKVTPYIVVLSILVLSHNITAFTGIIVSVLYLVLVVSGKKELLQTGKVLLLSLFAVGAITAFFWIPVVVESGQTKLVELKTDYQVMFVSLKNLIYAPWGFGAYQMGESPGKMTPQIGVMHLVFLVCASLILGFRFYYRKNSHYVEKEKITGFFVCIFFVCTFLILPESTFVWEVLPLIAYIQLPWRLLGFITLASCVCTAYLFSLTQKKIRLIAIPLCVICLLYVTRNQVRVNQYISFVDPFVTSPTYALSTTSKDEHMPLWAPRPKGELPFDGGLYPASAGTSTRSIWKTNHIQYKVSTTEQSTFMHYGYDFPGWEAFIDGQKVSYTRGIYEFGGLMVALPAGGHTVDYYFREPWYRKIANALSVGGILVFIGVICLPHATKVFSRVRNS